MWGERRSVKAGRKPENVGDELLFPWRTSAGTSMFSTPRASPTAAGSSSSRCAGACCSRRRSRGCSTPPTSCAPLFSSDLGFEERKKWAPTSGESKAWPRHYKPAQANIVFVAPDWSDLEDTIRWLEQHLTVAGGIAQRQRDLFVKGGYFSPAAEACYWRSLIRGWSKVVRTGSQGWEEQVGMPWEQFVLGHRMDRSERI